MICFNPETYCIKKDSSANLIEESTHIMRKFGVVVSYSLRVREAAGSNPATSLLVFSKIKWYFFAFIRSDSSDILFQDTRSCIPQVKFFVSSAHNKKLLASVVQTVSQLLKPCPS
jgi:hypothetical protein